MWRITSVTAPILSASQFGMQSNLDANQFESGVELQSAENYSHGDAGGGFSRVTGKQEDMKRKLILQTVAILLFVSFPACAKQKSHPFFLRTTVTMNGAEVPSGIYDLSWEPDKSGVRVTLWKDGRFFATAQGVWVKNGLKYTNDAALLRVNPDGSRSLMEIRLAGVKKSIVLENIDPVVQRGAK